MKKLLSISAVTLSLALPMQAQASTVFKQHTVTADNTTKQYVLPPSKRQSIYVSIWHGHSVIPQKYVNNCGAYYQSFRLGVYLTVTLPKCGTNGNSPFVVRYVSVKRPVTITIKFSSSDIQSDNNTKPQPQ